MKKASQNLTLGLIRQNAIDITNFVPKGVEVPSFFEFIDDRLEDVYRSGEVENEFYGWLESLNKYPKLADFLIKKDTENFDEIRSKAATQFDTFRQIRSFVELLADYADQYREKVEAGNPHWYYRDLELPARLWIGDPNTKQADGIIRFRSEWFTDVFIGADINKIRRCKKCGNVFWQSRKDKTTCSKSCSTVVAVRKHRGQPSNKE